MISKQTILIELDLMYFFYPLSKLAGRYNRDLTQDEKQKCQKDTFAFDGDNCVEKAVDFFLKLKVEEYKDEKLKFSNIIYKFTLIMDLVLILGLFEIIFLVIKELSI